MNRENEIVFMQIRLLRFASKKWNLSIQETNKVFSQQFVYKFISDCYEIFHTEGDPAIFEDVELFLKNKGVVLDTGVV